MLREKMDVTLVAEIGINLRRSLRVAKRNGRCSPQAGVEVVKRKPHIVEDEMSGAESNSEIPMFPFMRSWSAVRSMKR
jgi:sialic acid synthase SpsE